MPAVIENVDKMIHCGDSSHGSAGNFIHWRTAKHFDYTFLRNAFRKVLLDKMTADIGPSFRKIKNDIYKNHADGFYVRAKPNLILHSGLA